MHRRLAWFLIPFALGLTLFLAPSPAQASGFVLQAQQKPPFEDEIERFEAEDARVKPPLHPVVFVGSSSIQRWSTLSSDFPHTTSLNRGFGGSEISDSVRYAKRIVTKYQPKMIVFFAGTNDLESGKSVQTVFDDFRQFVKVVREDCPSTPIIYISITPAPSRWKNLDKVEEANRLIKDYCRSNAHLRYLDVFKSFLTKDGGPRPELFVSDQLHLKPAGYAIWVRALGPLLPKD